MVGNHVSKWVGFSFAKIPLFSNPLMKDVRCGIDTFGNPLACGNVERGDAVRSLNMYANNFEKHQTIDVHAVSYDDALLAACIEEQYPNDIRNDDTDVDKIYSINCSNHGISNISGIEK